MIGTVFDIETDGLYNEVTKIHCLVAKKFFTDGTSQMYKFTDPQEIKEFVESQEVLIGHNIKIYDIPVLVKLLNCVVKARTIDTLPVSWYLYPQYKEHGLEEWGERLGIQKPVILDWQNLTQEEYLNRCTKDVEINSLLLFKEMDYLTRIYEEQGTKRILGYLNFKMESIEEQHRQMCRVDVPALVSLADILAREKEARTVDLIAAMPPNNIYVTKTRPKVLFKKDGNLSSHGERWFELLRELDLPENTESVKVIRSTEPGKPNSHVQLKNWLFSLGWEPTIFEYKRDKETNENRAIPQISDEDGEICPSIERLIAKEPALANLKGLSIVNHRIGVVKSFLENTNSDGYTIADAGGLTNTLRFKHRKPIANLPSVHKPYGKEIRAAIIPPDGMILCGSDMSGLEDSTKHHYMYKYDPDYVNEMRTPGYDAHLSIGVFANMLIAEQEEFYKQYNKDKKENDKLKSQGLPPVRIFTEEEHTRMEHISEIRKKAKVVNFSAVYGVGAKKMALKSGMTVEECILLLRAYWLKNWAVKKVADDTYWKTVDGQMWLWNPVSEFWYSLRYEKDKFSTLNQGTGVYCFDTWLRKVRAKGIKMVLQYHDEKASVLMPEQKEEWRDKLQQAIDETNDELKLNVKLGISIDFGDNYAQIH